MSSFQVALLVHIVGAILYFGGLIVASLALLAARGRERPGEIAAILSLSRKAVFLVLLGGLLLLVFGFWLVDLGDHGLDDAWISAAIGLFVAAAAFGTIGGQRPKQARKLAARLAGEGNQPSAELRRLLRDPASDAMNLVSALAAVAVLVLMVWQPGS